LSLLRFQSLPSCAKRKNDARAMARHSRLRRALPSERPGQSAPDSMRDNSRQRPFGDNLQHSATSLALVRKQLQLPAHRLAHERTTQVLQRSSSRGTGIRAQPEQPAGSEPQKRGQERQPRREPRMGNIGAELQPRHTQQADFGQHLSQQTSAPDDTVRLGGERVQKYQRSIARNRHKCCFYRWRLSRRTPHRRRLQMAIQIGYGRQRKQEQTAAS